MKLELTISRPHALPIDEAKKRLRSAVSGLVAMYGGATATWPSEDRSVVTFSNPRTKGSATASVSADNVVVCVDAEVVVPMFVPAAAVGAIVESGVKKAIEGAFA